MTNPNPLPSGNRAEEIAASLTKAQADVMLRAPCPSWWGPKPACFPLTRQTTFALYRKGLVERVLTSSNAVALTDTGLAVRDILRSRTTTPENPHD